MLATLIIKLGPRIAGNPAILVEAAPILVPVVAIAAIHDIVEKIRK